jgi:hypothetical protein
MTKMMIPLPLWVNIDLETDGSIGPKLLKENKRELLGFIEILYFMTLESGYEYTICGKKFAAYNR